VSDEVHTDGRYARLPCKEARDGGRDGGEEYPQPIKPIVKLAERKGPKFTTYTPLAVPWVKIL